jgi:hypothetical protein
MTLGAFDQFYAAGTALRDLLAIRRQFAGSLGHGLVDAETTRGLCDPLLGRCRVTAECLRTLADHLGDPDDVPHAFTAYGLSPGAKSLPNLAYLAKCLDAQAVSDEALKEAEILLRIRSQAMVLGGFEPPLLPMPPVATLLVDAGVTFERLYHAHLDFARTASPERAQALRDARRAATEAMDEIAPTLTPEAPELATFVRDASAKILFGVEGPSEVRLWSLVVQSDALTRTLAASVPSELRAEAAPEATEARETEAADEDADLSETAIAALLDLERVRAEVRAALGPGGSGLLHVGTTMAMPPPLLEARLRAVVALAPVVRGTPVGNLQGRLAAHHARIHAATDEGGDAEATALEVAFVRAAAETDSLGNLLRARGPEPRIEDPVAHAALKATEALIDLRRLRKSRAPLVDVIEGRERALAALMRVHVLVPSITWEGGTIEIAHMCRCIAAAVEENGELLRWTLLLHRRALDTMAAELQERLASLGPRAAPVPEGTGGAPQ